MSGRSSKRGLRRTPAFSLLEIVLVLALFGLVSALLVAGGTALLRNADRDSTEHKALTALARARHQAVLTGRILELRYDDRERRLDWEEGSETLAGEDELRLLPPAQEAAMLLGGRVVEKPLARVRFHPDGTCEPFRIEITPRSGPPLVLAIDPWTCTVLAPLPAGRK